MADQTNSSPEVRRLIKRAQDINAERLQKVDELAAVRGLLQQYATLDEIGADDQPAVGALFSRQFPDWAPVEEEQTAA